MKTLVKKWMVLVLLAGALSFLQTACADEVANPVTQLQTLIDSMQKDVAAQHYTLQKNPDQLYSLVKKNIMPDMAVDRMSAMALGPKWRTATPAQRTEFVDQFSLMLTRAYASALLKVNEYTITIFPLRGDEWKTADNLALPGSIAQTGGGQASSVTYYVVREGNRWKIYDFAVEGVSIMNNFHTQLQSFPTMDAVLKRIKQVNSESL